MNTTMTKKQDSSEQAAGAAAPAEGLMDRFSELLPPEALDEAVKGLKPGDLSGPGGQNIDRLHGEASFAALCGASPIPASSGKRTRHRLNRGGDRNANRALHLIAVCRLRYCERTRAYAERRTREGKTQKEIMRCLKRYIAREIYTSLKADLADHGHSNPPATTTIMCGSPGFAINRT